MKFLISALLVLSAFTYAEEYKYDPVPNKAEYFMGKFNENRDMDDLLKWGDKFVDWMEDKSAWDSMESVVSVSYKNLTLPTNREV